MSICQGSRSAIARLATVSGVLALLAACASVPGNEGPEGGTDPVFADYVAGPEIIRGEGDGADTVRGVVFEDFADSWHRLHGPAWNAFENGAPVR